MNHAHKTLGALARLAHHPELALLMDLDGTLIPFAASPELAPLGESAAQQLRVLDELRVQVVIVSGRPYPTIEPLLGQLPRAWWVAEHGVWRNAGNGWSGPSAHDAHLDPLFERFTALTCGVDGARLG